MTLYNKTTSFFNPNKQERQQILEMIAFFNEQNKWWMFYTTKIINDNFAWFLSKLKGGAVSLKFLIKTTTNLKTTGNNDLNKRHQSLQMAANYDNL